MGSRATSATPGSSRAVPGVDAARQALTAHAREVGPRHLRELFAADPGRAERMHLEVAGWYCDFSKHRVTPETMRLLVALARARSLPERVVAMFRGEHVNVTEDRAALHVALRMPKGHSLVVDGVDVVAQVHEVLDRVEAFAARVRSEARITDVVNLGIGGSDLGPATVYDALRAYAPPGLRAHFVANVDGAALASVLRELEPARTLFVVASKTFTTVETMTNARTARAWVVDALGADAVTDHFVAVSTNREAVAQFGIDPANVFEFWDWVGGRFSLWSAIGLAVAVVLGPERFRELLAGAHEMDEHFRGAPPEQNLPVTMALLSYWYREHLGAQSHAVVPYAQVLERLPAHLQQLEMESLGKRVRLDGTPVDTQTGAVVWGSPGTNAQHAYFQLLHQGTALVPVDLIGFARAQPGLDPPGHHDLLVANLLAQAEALAFGTDDPALPPHRVMPGNRPTTTLLAERCTPRAVGALIAAYEHKVAALGVLWDVDAFDQWGVELGKRLASGIAGELTAGDEPSLAHDPSTNALIRLVRGYRSSRAPSASRPPDPPR